MPTRCPLSAEEAHEWGLANRLREEAAAVREAALSTARAIAASAPLSARQAKKSISHGLRMDLRTAFRFEVGAHDRPVPTEDRLGGVWASREKRRPVFEGRRGRRLMRAGRCRGMCP